MLHTASTALEFFNLLEHEWSSLCSDIEGGEICSNLDIKSDIRIALNKSLTALPDRAMRAQMLRNEFSKGFKGIVPRIWPSCALASAIGTGGFTVQVS